MTGIDDALIEGFLKKAGAPPVASQDGLAVLTKSLSEIADYVSEVKSCPR